MQLSLEEQDFDKRYPIKDDDGLSFQLRMWEAKLENAPQIDNAIGMQNFLAGSQAIMRPLLQAALDRLNIKEKPLEIDVSNGEKNLAALVRNQLEQYADKLLAMEGSIIPIIVKGYETHAALTLKELNVDPEADLFDPKANIENRGWFIRRYGHDYNQVLYEKQVGAGAFPQTQLAHELLKQGKRLAIFNLIDLSQGKNVYSLALASAHASHFYDFIIETEPKITA